MDDLTTAKLQELSNASARHLALSQEIDEIFVARYGVTYSDADCDTLIDTLDYGGGDITLREADSAMALCGYPKLKKKKKVKETQWPTYQT